MQRPWGRKEQGPRQDWRTGDGAWWLQRHPGRGRGLGRIPQGVSGPREAPAPGSLRPVGCGAGLLWEERPLRLSAPPGAHSPCPVRPSVLVHGSSCCT